jgi:glycosyltransferase involved in cell wall biosynthesis
MAEKKRILFVLNNFTFGGVQVQALYIGEIYRRAGHEVVFWCTKGNTDPAYIERLKNAGITYRICTFIDKFSRRMVHPRFWLYLPKVYGALRADKFDLILPFSFHVSVVMNAFYKLAGSRQCFFMERIGAPFFQNYNLWLDDFALRNTSGLITNSEHAARDFAAFYKLSSVPVKVIPNAVSIRVPKQGRLQWRSSLGIPENSVVVTMIANFTQIKDHITLLRAWQAYQARYTDIPTFLVVAGLQYNDKHSDAFNDFVAKNPIPNYRYIGSTPDSAGLIQASEIGVLSSLAEGCPNIVLEFMAFGKAFIGTSIPGILEVLPEESKPFTFVTGDDGKCVTLLRELIVDAGKRQRLGEINQKHVNQTFTEEKLKAAYMDLVES